MGRRKKTDSIVSEIPESPPAQIENCKDDVHDTLKEQLESIKSIGSDKLPILKLQDDEDEDEKAYLYPSPTDEQLALINQYVPAGCAPIQKEEVAVFSIVAADNFLNRGLGKWSLDGLKALAKMAPGLPAIFDHDWDEVGKTKGKIFDAKVVKCTNQDTIRKASSKAGNQYYNEEFVFTKDGGYWVLVIDTYFPLMKGIPDAIRFSLLDGVSLGGFVYNLDEVMCPICEVPFADQSCPHVVPMPHEGLLFEDFDEVAPYYIRGVPYDLAEISFTSFPNLPFAGVLNSSRSLV